VHLDLGSCIIRDWAAGDLAALVRHANNRNIWINVRDRFPHPYREEHGREFLSRISTQSPQTTWAIAAHGEAVGGIGLMLLTDVERVSAEIGPGRHLGGIPGLRPASHLCAAVRRQPGVDSRA
jgi:[ribosomal protein S5]-alanine N-acetyltransferase